MLSLVSWNPVIILFKEPSFIIFNSLTSLLGINIELLDLTINVFWMHL